ncbi:sulfite exporter TauE/SafE family protein [Chitinophaga oryziterrae]|uniref:Sulfite exporter TauE/SafE family protein n=1 Tax=Chitinophaga oryziterrae TaxID=1031224 RepID=A0A6N8JDR9_9BACT|nr:sulfite exporter TauE/SafE family protein [Chitinophaga oryziterrae]MVT42496.1 sulfite exporter TauE/SafE family protein [Chitinophaga oryziterrae]
MFLTFLYALSLGFIGSFHCIGMCGPIALTLPVQHLDGTRKMAGILLYNAGRITAYSGIGIASGWLGRQFYIGGLQQWLSITIGCGLLLAVIFRNNRFHFSTGIYGARIKKILGNLLRQQKLHTLYAIGFFNGLLPCGLVYFAVAGAVATGSITQGALFMCAFGTGTLPAMVTISWCSQIITVHMRNKLRQCVPYAVALMAVLLILRGMNLGIPYISPAISKGKIIEHCYKPS